MEGMHTGREVLCHEEDMTNFDLLRANQVGLLNQGTVTFEMCRMELMLVLGNGVD